MTSIKNDFQFLLKQQHQHKYIHHHCRHHDHHNHNQHNNQKQQRRTVVTSSSSRRMLILLSTALQLLLLLRPSATFAQESPSIIIKNKFDTSTSYRTNVCDRQYDVWEGKRQLPQALEGLNLTAVLTNYRVPDENKYFTLLDGKIKKDDPGLFAVILDEVASRAGFKWRHTFGVTSPIGEDDAKLNKTWTDLLYANIQNYDISMEKWGRSLQRLEMGISFPEGWWDSSIVLVERVHPNSETLEMNLWSFLSPFQPNVWLLIICTIVYTGMLYWLLEYLDTNADERNLEEKPLEAVYYSAMVFVGNLDLRPRTDAARIVVWSWTFWTVIVGSAYTANLASFLVSPQIINYRVSTIDEAIRINARICVQQGGVLSTILKNKYGEDNLNLISKDTEAGIFDGLFDNSCDVAAHQVNTYRIYEKNILVNYDCSLDSELRVVQPIPAGMATAIDTGSVDGYCTSLISHVLDYHLTEMVADGFIEKVWKTHLNKVSTIECISEPPRGGSGSSGSSSGGSSDENTYSLSLLDVGGIFILHGSVVAIAIAISLFQFYYYGTSNNTLAEVFFVKQAKQEIKRRRESIRASFQPTHQTSSMEATTAFSISARQNNDNNDKNGDDNDDDSNQSNDSSTNENEFSNSASSSSYDQHQVVVTRRVSFRMDDDEIDDGDDSEKSNDGDERNVEDEVLEISDLNEKLDNHKKDLKEEQQSPSLSLSSSLQSSTLSSSSTSLLYPLQSVAEEELGDHNDYGDDTGRLSSEAVDDELPLNTDGGAK